MTEAEKVLAKALDIDVGELSSGRVERFVAERTAVADLLLSQALLPELTMSIDTTAQILLVLESIDRLTSAGLRRHSWRLPLLVGRIVLPIALERLNRPAVSRMSAMLVANTGNGDTPAPPRKWMGDLVLLRQQVRGYKLAEIAHVENVLKGEDFERTFRTKRTTAQRISEETETERETERDLQTTTRDEIRSEIQKAVSEELALAANFNVQVSYNGGAYSVVAGVGASASYRRASEEREATSSMHAREVIDKARERISTRVLSAQESMTTYEQEDQSKHGLENKTGPDHIVGVYRWIEKQLDMHLINYGRRLIYEFMVPEPATFWKRLVDARGTGAAGPPPTFPVVPPVVAGGTGTTLSPDDFSLRSGNPLTPMNRPARWFDLVALAAEWGVQLEDPPPVALQSHLAFSLPGAADQPSTAAINRFGSPNDGPGSSWYYESPIVVSELGKERLKVPEGYIARSGTLSIKGWMYVRQKPNGIKQYERGYATVLLNGRRFATSEGLNAPNSIGADGNEYALDQNSVLQTPLEGEVAVAVTTNLNGISGSIRLDCGRTPEWETAWAKKMFGLFARAYQARMDEYRDNQTRAGLENTQWAGSFPSATCREIERRELKRGVISQLTLNNLGSLGTAVVIEPPPSAAEAPPAPVVRLNAIDAYTRFVLFFEHAFDWTNVAYMFSPYMYGRRAEWANLAVADDADAQFKSFLSAGAARVQVPVRRGFEPQVEYFFNGLGVHSLDQRIPWLGSMRSIAEDLAAEAREGFEIGQGTISATLDSEIVTGTGTAFRDPEDLNREIRIEGKLYIIASVDSATQIRLAQPFADPTVADRPYETGGIVVGPTIPVSLPTTLVAIDRQGLTLPEFSARYA